MIKTFIRQIVKRLEISLVCFLLVGASSPTSAEDFYVGQTALGNGFNAAAATNVTFFNTIGNWGDGAGKISAGDTIHLVGTITNRLIVCGSGSQGSPITIYFEPNARMSAPIWPPDWWGGGAISIDNQNYVTIDGGSNGIIEATDNGTALGHQSQSIGVGALTASHFTVKNLIIRNMYVRTSDTDQSNGFGIGVMNSVNGHGGIVVNYTVTNCTISDAYIGIESEYSYAKAWGSSSNYFFVGNTIYRCNWGGNCASRQAGSSMANLVVANNHIYDFTNWNDTVNNKFHHNGFFAWADGVGTVCDGVKYYGNTIGPNFGGPYSTSGMWAESDTGNMTNVLMFNNLFICNPNDAPANAMLQGTEGIIANNTFLGGRAGVAISVGKTNHTTVIKNNLIVNCATAFMNNTGVGTLIMDSNLVWNVSADAYASLGSRGISDYLTLTQMRNRGYEVHTLNANPLINKNGTLQSRSPAIEAGANLSHFFTTDFSGNPRPATGRWTIGAYQMPEASPVLSPPAGLRIQKKNI